MTHDRSRKRDEISWRTVQQVRPGYEEILLDGNAQSVRYGEPLRGRSGQPENINSQEVANSQNFIMGSDTTEFMNRLIKQVRKKTEKNDQRCRRKRRTFYNWVKVFGCDDEFCDIHGKEFPRQSELLSEHIRSHTKKMYDISSKLVVEQDEIFNVDTIHWENTHGNICH